MCGRFTIKTDLRTLGDRFHFDPEGLTFQPRFNLPPTDEALTIVDGHGRKAIAMRWGLKTPQRECPRAGTPSTLVTTRS